MHEYNLIKYFFQMKILLMLQIKISRKSIRSFYKSFIFHEPQIINVVPLPQNKLIHSDFEILTNWWSLLGMNYQLGLSNELDILTQQNFGSQLDRNNGRKFFYLGNHVMNFLTIKLQRYLTSFLVSEYWHFAKCQDWLW